MTYAWTALFFYTLMSSFIVFLVTLTLAVWRDKYLTGRIYWVFKVSAILLLLHMVFMLLFAFHNIAFASDIQPQINWEYTE